MSDYHSDRQTLLKLLAPDSVPDDQPFILQYEGATTTKRIEAHYAGGLEMRGPRGYAETVALRFLAANNPLWYGLNETVGTLLAKSATVRLFVGWIDGAWDEFGPPNATGTYTDIRDILYVNESSIYICGDFVNFDNNGIDYIAHWNGSAWEAVGDPDSGTAVITRAYEMAL
ncbi:MAG: hypothetical protein GTO41_14390, partial [Burkholderiales bacterium]|nr:hypothetical protein [Burkholderiales bacterium]